MSTIQLAFELLHSIALVQPDALDCDGCFDLIAEFAEAECSGVKLSEALQAVQTHLQQCPCCRYEYEAMLEALASAENHAS